MSTGHANYTGEVRVSYDAEGVYVLKYPSGTRFRNFGAMLDAFVFHFGWRGPYGEFAFDLEHDRVWLTARNTRQTVREYPDGRKFVFHERFRGEIRFFDVCGLRISAKDVEANLLRCRGEWEESRAHGERDTLSRRWCWNQETFRRGPVPLTGSHGGWGGAFKGPSIFREQKETDFMRFDEDCREYGVRPRAWRVSHLPDGLWWDNWSREQWRDRSWKRHRRHQWKD